MRPPAGQKTVVPFAVPKASATVKLADEAIEPRVALTVVCPGDPLIAKPPGLIVATLVDEELQNTLWVTSFMSALA